jgi:putative nucleotidyltransferase with HDIG domain
VTRLSSWANSRDFRLTSGEGDEAASSTRRVRGFSRSLIDALARTLEVRDGSTREHAARVQRLAVTLALEHGIGDAHLIEAIHAAALLHDIGKLAIPDSILLKPGPLTPDEYEFVKQHAVIGAQILAPLAGCAPLAVIVRHHHENWDGSGYPDGLQGKDIPLGARILAIADCYDALTSDRPYRRELSHETAIGMIRDRRGTMYDPDLVDGFLGVMRAARNPGPRSLPSGALPVRDGRRRPSPPPASARGL